MPFDRPTIHRNVRRLQVRIVQATKASRWGKVQTLQRLLIPRNRVSPKEAFEGLELCERKLSCTVLRGLDGSNPVRLLGNRGVEPGGLRRLVNLKGWAARQHP
jgi:N-terminal domain of reverse transcriptase